MEDLDTILDNYNNNIKVESFTTGHKSWTHSKHQLISMNRTNFIDQDLECELCLHEYNRSFAVLNENICISIITLTGVHFSPWFTQRLQLHQPHEGREVS